MDVFGSRSDEVNAEINGPLLAGRALAELPKSRFERPRIQGRQRTLHLEQRPQRFVVQLRPEPEVRGCPIPIGIEFRAADRPARTSNPRAALEVEYVERRNAAGPDMRTASQNPGSENVLVHHTARTDALNLIERLSIRLLVYATTLQHHHIDIGPGEFGRNR